MFKSKWSRRVGAAIASLPAIALVATTQALAADKFGAIAYSEATGGYGYSRDYPTQGDAEIRALNECEAHSGSSDCQVLLWFRNACGALATASNGAYGSGWGINRSIAEGYAVETCSAYGADCAPIMWVCTSR
ncbi:DUF4189 domain-containing protein [Oscillatoria sp. FACHB-1407]|uniref:DUF4189 domain-containing protein n=1 Tax=Oscillatoria sp. FACHB-1407 TaxID=2692847 RepID=UPI001685C7D8|nr:DUF4189 domain-containing protein [Oscillatoria sp. FACHB-1407]MBD2464521.1 DUF4189 domain-containing protein [Oscillatoria sp. FACHB-1407]